MATAIEPFPLNVLEALGGAIGNSYSHRQLDDLFARAHMTNEASGARWLRVRENAGVQQSRDRAANTVLRLVIEALSPANFVSRPEGFEPLRTEVNKALSFVGLYVNDRGEVQRIAKARTLTEAEARADRLRSELNRRRVHADVLRFCSAELLVENYFHATFEAAKSVADKIRRLTGLSGDGVSLVNQALDRKSALGPYLVFNTLSTATEQSEHDGLADMARGLFRVFRNVPAHLPRIDGDIGEQEAMDLFTLASYLHRRLDAAQQTHRCST